MPYIFVIWVVAVGKVKAQQLRCGIIQFYYYCYYYYVLLCRIMNNVYSCCIRSFFVKLTMSMIKARSSTLCLFHHCVCDGDDDKYHRNHSLEEKVDELQEKVFQINRNKRQIRIHAFNFLMTHRSSSFF